MTLADFVIALESELISLFILKFMLNCVLSVSFQSEYRSREMSQRYEKLVALLQELFRLDQPDLDFGFYRIMRALDTEVLQFLEQDLLPQIGDILERHGGAERLSVEKELAEAVKNANKLGIAPDQTPVVRNLRAKLAETLDVGTLEADVYDHLYRFFRRYYSNGDFLSHRVYKPGVYAIPYEGEEIKLHWANADQYYIKTFDYLRDYSFRLRLEEGHDPLRVHFRLVDAMEGEHNNVEPHNGNRRVFLLQEQGFMSAEDSDQGQELVICFEYRPATLCDWPAHQRAQKARPPKQNDLVEIAEERILGSAESAFSKWLEVLRQPHEKGQRRESVPSRLKVHLHRYTARNTFDYFIHKDLGSFLHRELDFYIKNEVMHLDDVENETVRRVHQYLSRVKVLRRIGGKIIDFLSQINEFQRKLWLKKRFVTETFWCIQLGCIPKRFHAEIAANVAQRQEWEQLLAIDEIEKDLCTPAYKVPLSAEFLAVHPTLTIDTRHFAPVFVQRLLSSFEDLDRYVDGELIYSENFQALSLMQSRLANRVRCIYIDPPYNTDSSEILYKNNYKHSSWLSLMSDRLAMGRQLLTSQGVQITAIDDTEFVVLNQLLDSIFPQHDRNTVVVNHHPAGAGLEKTNISATHEYAVFLTPKGAKVLLGTPSDGEQRPIAFMRTGTAESNLRVGRPNSFYSVLVDSRAGVVQGAEPPPPPGGEYPTGNTDDGLQRIYPVSQDGTERVWRRSYEGCLREIEQGNLLLRNGKTLYLQTDPRGRHRPIFSNWTDSRFNAGVHGTTVLKDILGKNVFSYPKSVHTVSECIQVATRAHTTGSNIVLDYFAGSGTTGQATIHLNREDGQRRKFVLVEMGDHFDTVLLPRLKKIVFSPAWKNGKPLRWATSVEAERSPRIMQVVRLESFEDTLANLKIPSVEKQLSTLNQPETQTPGGFKEQYFLRYLLDLQSRGSPSLLNVRTFADPTAYSFKEKRPGSDESCEVSVDLPDTFNRLLGLSVRRISVPQSYDARFQRDVEGRLCLEDALRETAAGKWWFRYVLGTMPDGREVLVVWRKRPGGDAPIGVEQDNLVLDTWFDQEGFTTEQGSRLHIVYVNGSCNLELLRPPSSVWRVRLTESEFHRLMFASTTT